MRSAPTTKQPAWGAAFGRGTLLVTMLSLLAILPASAQDDDAPTPGTLREVGPVPATGQPMWETTSRLYRGTVYPILLTDTAHDPTEVTPETLEQLAKLQKRAARDGQHPEGPSLMAEEVIDVSAVKPLSPPMALRAPGKAPGDFTIFQTSDPSTVVSSGFRSTTNEPTAVIAGNQALYTANWYAAQSDDGGQTWTLLNPFTGPFAPANDGFCCDQVSVYHPKTNTIFFLQQYIEDGTTGTQRINVDRNADGTWDCAYNYTPQDMGFATNNWADFPDFAVSDNYIYHSSNVFPTGPGSFTGAFAARYPLADMSACAAVTFDVMTDTSFGSFRFTRGATDTMYFGAHITLSSLRIWSWPEASMSPTTTDRSVTAWLNNTRTCPGPDGRDWCGFIDFRMMGGFVAGGEVGFLWVPSQGGSFPYPYTRVSRFTEGTLALAGEDDIWSTDFAWVYPSAAVNAAGEIGGTIHFGGGDTYYPSCAVWLADSENSGTFAPLENAVVAFGTSGPGPNRSGDYTWAQPSYPDDEVFVGACFIYNVTSSSSSRFVKFGREENAAVFFDGFESGNTTAWTVP